MGGAVLAGSGMVTVMSPEDVSTQIRGLEKVPGMVTVRSPVPIVTERSIGGFGIIAPKTGVDPKYLRRRPNYK
jgi:hypothetical protein